MSRRLVAVAVRGRLGLTVLHFSSVPEGCRFSEAANEAVLVASRPCCFECA